MNNPDYFAQLMRDDPAVTIGLVIDPNVLCEDVFREKFGPSELRDKAARIAYARGCFLVAAGRPNHTEDDPAVALPADGGCYFLIEHRAGVGAAVLETNARMAAIGARRTMWFIYTDAELKAELAALLALHTKTQGTA